MKKMILLILSLFLVFGIVGYNIIKPEKQSVSSGVSNSDVEGVFVEIEGIYTYSDKTTLAVKWVNNTEFPLTYGEMYSIERLENGEWKDCSLRDNIFILLGYLLQPNETINKEYLITDRFDISKPGTYRFCADCSVDMPIPKECFVWAEFTIK